MGYGKDVPIHTDCIFCVDVRDTDYFDWCRCCGFGCRPSVADPKEKLPITAWTRLRLAVECILARPAKVTQDFRAWAGFVADKSR